MGDEGKTMDVRVAVIEDDARYRLSLEQLLAHAPGFSLAASFPSAVAALRKVDGAGGADAPPWDVALMDLEMPGLGGIEATRRLKALFPDLKVIVVTVFEEASTILESICAGADGYLLKRTRARDLLDGIRTVAEGGAPLTPNVARKVLEVMRQVRPVGEPGGEAPSRLDLTEREQQVLRGLVEGLAYKQVADVLGISLGTVRTHITSIYRKLQVHTVVEAVSRAIREGIV